MSLGSDVVDLARMRAGQYYYTNDWWARMHPDESGGTDCSGLVRYCYLKGGVDVGTWTGDESHAGVEIARGHYPAEIPWGIMKPGDLIFMTANYWDNYDFSEYLCHVEIYCGGGTMIGHPGGYGPREKWAQPWMESYGCITWMVRRIEEEDMTPTQAAQLDFIYNHMVWNDQTHFSDLGNLVTEMPIDYPSINDEGEKVDHTAPLGKRLGYIDQRMHVIEANQAEILKKLDEVLGGNPD